MHKAGFRGSKSRSGIQEVRKIPRSCCIADREDLGMLSVLPYICLKLAE